MHPRSKHWHLLDYVIVRRSDRRDVHLTRAMRGAECWTDHPLVCASIQLNIRPPVRKRQPKKRLDVRACDDPLKMDLLRENIFAKLQSIPHTDPLVHKDTEALTAEWTDLSRCFTDAATASLGISTKKTPRLVRQQQRFHQAYSRKKCRSCCQASKSVIHCTAP